MKEKLQKQKHQNKLITCCSCGSEKPDTTYYMSRSRVYKYFERLPVCKNCIGDMFTELFEKYGSNKQAIYELCQKYDVCFNNNTYLGAVQDASKTGKSIYQAYFSKINSFGKVNGAGSDFSDSDKLVSEEERLQLDAKTNGENIDSEDDQDDGPLMVDLEENFDFTEQDQQVKDDVIRLLGYDVFSGYSISDQKFLYNELLTYLDEDTLEDSFKLSQVIQLINNNNQIRKMDLVINTLSSSIKSLTLNQSEIKALSAIKNQIVQATDKIAKENSISVKNRGDKSAGKSTLTYLMKNYRELGFEDAEQDYYDQLKAHGMKLVADISHKSIIDQLQLDENDKNDMLATQRQLLNELYAKVDDLEEENRQLHAMLSSKDSDFA